MENRVIEFGYSSNLGGVEVFIKNIIMNTSIPIDLVATTQDKIPFEDEFVANGSRIFRIPNRRSAPMEYKRNIENILREHPEIKRLMFISIHAAASKHSRRRKKLACSVLHTATVPIRTSINLQKHFTL